MNTVPPLTIIDGSRSLLAGLSQNRASAGQGAGSLLSAGSLLQATVVAADNTNQFTLDIAGGRFQVASQIPLYVGQTLELQVASSKDGLQLQFVQDSLGQTLGRSLASGSSEINNNIFSLLQDLPPEQINQLDKASHEIIARFRNTIDQFLTPADSGKAHLNRLLERITASLVNTGSPGNSQAIRMELQQMLQEFGQLLQPQEGMGLSQQIAFAALPAERLQLYATLQQFAGQNGSAASGEPKQTFQQLLQMMQIDAGDFLSLERLPVALTRLQEKLTDLMQFWQSSAPPHGSSAASVAEKLQQLVDALGLRMEALLATGKAGEAQQNLKATLSQMLQSPLSSASAVEQGQQVLRNIEFMQLAQVQLLRQDIFFFPLPLPFLDQGFVLVENYREQLKENQLDGDQPLNFSVYLKMEPLGNLRVDFLHGGEGLYIRFHSSSKTTRDFLALFGDELRQAIPAPPIRQVSFVDDAVDPLTVLVQKSGIDQETLFSATI